MSCMHCIVYALHSLAWRPASLSVRAFATSVFLLYGCCPGKQWPIDWTRNSQDNMNMLHHASDILHQDNKVAQAGTSTSRFTPRGASILALQKKRYKTEALYIYTRSLDSLDNWLQTTRCRYCFNKKCWKAPKATSYWTVFSAILFNVESNPVFGKLSEGIAQPPLLSDLQRNQRTRSTGAIEFKQSFESFDCHL